MATEEGLWDWTPILRHNPQMGPHYKGVSGARWKLETPAASWYTAPAISQTEVDSGARSGRRGRRAAAIREQWVGAGGRLRGDAAGCTLT